ncbi:MAG: hypothetical protein UR85_C0007G0038 [Candidatus Nomurabacteria bacterium GW2011_GWF2_35_66]|uniref:Uncharacterized protein n=1 Tax=Candidatus Nomurabacteria bacterium GW2011_GWE1_35_16 TaxID=1618761 RepID=A0A0G0EGC1_9BACT|nr:MAG: hypothetical protein UR55_C0009G0021 [Candidatus Nomurabacteria bacterium GW2011_GWF1_34_20]KKP62978.1 MAG: hypothetical protein UR57_C0009G0021 [Candidatus Nomurabacteria bacterium GW2011_GWE2_34_25]KKP66382.1 MAG: hypothetical protein UR64_C0008G0020 [Candidatus Nomurabacteria bacterium GW2011_GWE1_35_16]KKP83178.1 MAG: hypothetical protein UR85_C0007G0038 [Candidatus Nomurabacteria bacterium GW2011_GWF2_35_66]HAE36525.1 hypothetical protein [Candidatus Nomurabacteria bacterium]
MDIKDLNKKQLILLTLLITFVVSIATGIVTVSLMNQMPKAIPQTINNVIQRTIEKVTTVETPAKESAPATNTPNGSIVLGDGDAVVSIYAIDGSIPVTEATNQSAPSTTDGTAETPTTTKELGQGIIISDVGLVLVDSSILNESLRYKVILNKTDFDATVLKKFTNGFSILKISEKKAIIETPAKTDESKVTQ